MIALLTGNIASKSPDHLVIDVNGVGYRVQIPFSTYYELPEEGSVTLHIHMNVREDAIHLYGFASQLEKTFFQLLISVSGIGPKLGRDILSNIQPQELASALKNGDIHRLSAIPGIGKKTAERLVLELRDKVEKLEGVSPAEKSSRENSQPNPSKSDDITSALLNLGYKEQLVRKAMTELDTSGDTSVEELLRQALKILMK